MNFTTGNASYDPPQLSRGCRFPGDPVAAIRESKPTARFLCESILVQFSVASHFAAALIISSDGEMKHCVSHRRLTVPEK